MNAIALRILLSVYIQSNLFLKDPNSESLAEANARIFLLSHELIEVADEGRTYVITERGRVFVGYIKDLPLPHATWTME